MLVLIFIVVSVYQPLVPLPAFTPLFVFIVVSNVRCCRRDDAGSGPCMGCSETN
jgi:hypothetical protein